MIWCLASADIYVEAKITYGYNNNVKLFKLQNYYKIYNTNDYFVKESFRLFLMQSV